MKQKVLFIVCIKFHGCFLESTNYYDTIKYNMACLIGLGCLGYGLFNRVKFWQATYGLEIATYSVG